MPELPEVETVRSQLEEQVVGKEIAELLIHTPNILKGDIPDFIQHPKRLSITSISRKGKQLRFHFTNSKVVMLAHLKMTGQFLYIKNGQTKAGIFPLLYAAVPGGKKTAGHFREQQATKVLDKHVHASFSFADGSLLAFRDQRKFGYLKFISIDELVQVNNKLGIDPLYEEFTKEAFMKVFEKRSKSLKAVLMDQQLISGLGNIYADEICHRVGMKPQKSVTKLSRKKQEELYYATSDIIQEAVRNKGTTLKDFSDISGNPGEHTFHLQVYGRKNLECLRCHDGKINKITFLGRGTHYCNKCQK